MAVLDSRYHPLSRARLFAQMGISPYSPASELRQAADRLEASIVALPPELQDERRQIANAIRASIDDPRQRAVLAATCFDRLRQDELIGPLDEVQDSVLDDLRLPEMGMELLLIDGEDLALAEDDIEEIHPDPDMMPDFDGIKQYLQDQPCELHFLFDL